VFHVEHSYLGNWQRYVKALGQRNAALRSGADLAPWDQEVARYGTIVGEARAYYLDRLQPYVDEAMSHFFGDIGIRIRYAPGWSGDRPLLQVLKDERAADIRWGFTQAGPHKGDFALLMNGRPVRAFLSRGQTKVMAYALLLAQASFLATTADPACVLIDDLPSELDSDNRQRLMNYLASLRCQCFITAIHHQDLAVAPADDTAMFHVEHGRVARV
jgi:DNA replication and repair protein RecF